MNTPVIAALLSLLIPGVGQAYARHAYRGGVVFAVTALTLLTVVWYGEVGWYVVPLGIWLWNVWDAYGVAQGQMRSTLIPFALGLIAVYGIGWQVLQIDPSMASFDRALAIVRPMLRADFVEPRVETNRAWVSIEIPCSPAPPNARHEENGVTVIATSNCVALGETFIVSVAGLWPNADTDVLWRTVIGDPKMLGEGENQMLIVHTDETGSATTMVKVPSTALTAAPDPTLPQPHRIYFEQSRPIGGYQLSNNGGYVLKGMYESIAMALMSTTLAIFLAIPVSFLAARNLMSANIVTLGVYVVARTILNFIRSIEPIIIAIVFVVIVGLGPFAGVIAMMIHSIAALGKLYSEVIEGIDPGPIEAMRATGANWAQVVRYGVIPQVVPPFTAFTIYRWEINVRSSTVIGLVGGGGIGFYLIQWIQINDLPAVSATFIAIGIIVSLLDQLSASVRARMA